MGIKQQLMSGTKATKEIKIEGNKLYIRKLSDGELNQIELNMLDEKGEGEIKGDRFIPNDPASAYRVQRKAQNKLLALALDTEKNEDKWEEEDMDQLPREIRNELTTQVILFNKLEDDMTFRGFLPPVKRREIAREKSEKGNK